MRRSVPLCIALAVATTACNHLRTDDNAFNWSQELAAGGTLRVRDLNGAIQVVPAADGKTARVHATTHWRKGDPKRDLKFVVVTEGNDATICVHWGTGTCTATEYTNRRASGFARWFFRRGTDARVDFVVEVPAQTRVDVSTMNGDATVRATAPVLAKTVNGEVSVMTAIGPAEAKTVNGSVDVRMTTIGGAGDVRAETTNGDASAYVPQNVDGKVTLSTTNGEAINAFGLTALAGRKNRIEGVLGAGTRAITVHSVNGSVTLGVLDSAGRIVQGAKP